VLTRKRVGLVALERVPVREHTELQTEAGERRRGHQRPARPQLNQPVAMAYVRADQAALGTRLNAIVRGKAVPMQVAPCPSFPTATTGADLHPALQPNKPDQEKS
jgi:aminomethyltransferase